MANPGTSELRERLTEPGPPLRLDGGLGSMLIDRGLKSGSPPELWSTERPDDLLAVHQAYAQAGAEAIHTNTFGANPIRLAAFGLADRCEELNRAAVEVARRAGAGFVVADVGPTGEYLPPVGKGCLDAWREAFTEQARVLANAAPDAVHVETMSDLREALVALDALRDAAPQLPVIVSLTFDRKKRGFFTVMGDRPAASFARLAEHGAAAVGANCSITSPDMLDLARETLPELSRLSAPPPLVLQPNAGQPRLTTHGVVYDQSPDEFARDAAAMAAAGARAIGGCCGTDPHFIAALCQRLDRSPARQDDDG